MTKTKHIGWPFCLAAILILIFGMEIVWWQAILVAMLASFYVRIEYTTTSRPLARQIRRTHRSMTRR